MGDLADRTRRETDRRLLEMGLPCLSQLLAADASLGERIEEILRDATHHLPAADRIMELLREEGLV